MLDYKTIREIIQELKEQNYNKIATCLDDALYGSTGGEILDAVIFYCEQLKNEKGLSESTRVKVMKILRENK